MEKVPLEIDIIYYLKGHSSLVCYLFEYDTFQILKVNVQHVRNVKMVMVDKAASRNYRLGPTTCY